MVVEGEVEIPKEKSFHLDEVKWDMFFIQVEGSYVPTEIFCTY